MSGNWPFCALLYSHYKQLTSSPTDLMNAVSVGNEFGHWFIKTCASYDLMLTELPTEISFQHHLSDSKSPAQEWEWQCPTSLPNAFQNLSTYNCFVYFDTL